MAALDPRMREVLWKAALSFILRLFGAAAQFGFTVLVARLFGPTGLGAYALALSVAVIASTLARWGLDQATLKYVAIHASRGEKAVAGRLVRQAGLLVGGGSLAVTLLLWLAAPVLCREIFHDPELTWLMRLMALSIVPFSLLNLLAEALRGLQRIGAFTLIQGVLVPLTSVLLLAALHYTAGAELTGAAQVYVASCLITVFCAMLLGRVYLGRERQMPVPPGMAPMKSLIATASPLAWVTLISVAMSFTETLFLGIFSSSGDVGLYAAALRLALLVNFVIIAFNSILAPQFASLYNEGNFRAILSLSRKSIVTMLIVASPLLGIFLVAPRRVLALFGTEFSAASEALMVLSIGQMFSILVGPVGVFLMMTGHEKELRRNLAVSYLANLVAALLLIPPMGVMGGAWSATFGIVVLNLTCRANMRAALAGSVEKEI
jgi:O-antigen/teichoic acid export membrane protein